MLALFVMISMVLLLMLSSCVPCYPQELAFTVQLS